MVRRERSLERNLSRRAVVGGLATGLISGAPRLVFAQAAPYTTKFGDAEVIVISDGVMTLPTSYALPTTASADVSVLLSRHAAATGAFQAAVNVVVVRMPGALIVIDSGGTSDFMPTLGSFADRDRKSVV